MGRKKLLNYICFLVVFIFFLNLIANKFYWYNSISYFDMIMHTLGGIWLGFTAIFLFSDKNSKEISFSKVIAFVLFIGLLWELFEFGVGEILFKNPLNTPADTFSDLICDVVGGIIGYGFYFKNSLKGLFKL